MKTIGGTAIFSTVLFTACSTSGTHSSTGNGGTGGEASSMLGGSQGGSSKLAGSASTGGALAGSSSHLGSGGSGSGGAGGTSRSAGGSADSTGTTGLGGTGDASNSTSRGGASGGTGVTTGGTSSSGSSAGGTGGDASTGGTSGGTSGTGGRGGGAGTSAGGSSLGGVTGGASGGASGTGGGSGPSELIHYYGRWNRLADRGITVNTGSHVVAQFTGTGISAKFDTSLNKTPSLTMAWRIDQGTWQEGELAATLSLATGLSSGTHEVMLMVRGLNENQSRWSPPLVSSITFLGFEVSAGALQSSPRPVRPKIEFLGDSITEGINLFSGHNGQNTPCWNADGRRAYASQTAQSLNAEWRQVGFGRLGLLIEGNGGVPVANDAFNWIYKDVPRDDWQPDLVVVNQGTNDGSASATSFRPAYATYLKTIRTGYPEAKIAAMRPFNGAHAAEIKAEVDARRTGGDSRVFYVDTTGWLGNGDTTDGVHPNEQGSQKAAAALVTAIKSIGLP